MIEMLLKSLGLSPEMIGWQIDSVKEIGNKLVYELSEIRATQAEILKQIEELKNARNDA
jgi:hypothetical protein